jgi:hypothetical protein
MKTIRSFALALTLCAVSAWAADLIVQRATLWGPNGTVPGKLVIRGDQMSFIDDNNPDMSFIIPKTDVRAARWEGGRLTIDLAHPYASSIGANRSDLVFVMPDQTSAGSVITWMGVPVSGYSAGAESEANRTATPPSTLNITDVRFDVKNGDQRGKLMLQPDQLVFESLTDARHSRSWKYSDIRELTHNDHEIKVKGRHGDDYEFQIKNRAMLDTAYNLISDKVIAARQGH